MNERKLNILSSAIAQGLLDELVNSKESNPSSTLVVPEQYKNAYEKKLFLYKVATILISLLSEEQENRKFLAVRESFEELVFVKNRSDGEPLLNPIKAAMKDLQIILFRKAEGHPSTWAREWFQEIGVEMTNPVDLSLFVLHWLGYYIMVTDSLKDFDPA